MPIYVYFLKFKRKSEEQGRILYFYMGIDTQADFESQIMIERKYTLSEIKIHCK